MTGGSDQSGDGRGPDGEPPKTPAQQAGAILARTARQPRSPTTRPVRRRGSGGHGGTTRDSGRGEAGVCSPASLGEPCDRCTLGRPRVGARHAGGGGAHARPRVRLSQAAAAALPAHQDRERSLPQLGAGDRPGQPGLRMVRHSGRSQSVRRRLAEDLPPRSHGRAQPSVVGGARDHGGQPQAPLGPLGLGHEGAGSLRSGTGPLRPIPAQPRGSGRQRRSRAQGGPAGAPLAGHGRRPHPVRPRGARFRGLSPARRARAGADLRDQAPGGSAGPAVGRHG
jgi:hypothetical protein